MHPASVRARSLVDMGCRASEGAVCKAVLIQPASWTMAALQPLDHLMLRCASHLRVAFLLRRALWTQCLFFRGFTQNRSAEVCGQWLK